MFNDLDDIPYDDDEFWLQFDEPNWEDIHAKKVDETQFWLVKYRFNNKIPVSGPVTGRRFMRRLPARRFPWTLKNSKQSSD